MKKLHVKLPKKVAGIKVPKGLRKGPVGDFINSSGGQVLIAEALLLAARSLAVDNTSSNSAVGQALRHPLEAAEEAVSSGKRSAKAATHDATDAAAILSHAITEAVRAFRAAITQRPNGEQGAREMDDDYRSDDSAAGTQKKTSRSSSSPRASH